MENNDIAILFELLTRIAEELEEIKKALKK